MLDDLLQADNVVVRAPNALGDLIMATPAFARLAAHYKRVSLVCLPPGKALLEGNEWFAEILPYDRKGEHRGLLGGMKFAKLLRQRGFDLGILLPNSFGSAWQFFQGGVRRRVGYFKEGRSFLLHAGRERDHDAQGHFVPKYTGLYFMELLDVIGLPPAPLKPNLPVTSAERDRAATELAGRAPGHGPLVLVAPGAAFGPSKLWPPERFAEVANALADAGCRVLLSIGPGEEAAANAVRRAAGREYPDNTGLDLGTLKAVYQQAALVLTNDTGPRHMAVALGVPVVCIMGPNDPRYTALPQVEKGEVVRQPVDCAPYSWPCQLKQCPIDHRCMTAISTGRVLAACKAALGL
ncbi:MAG: lipopolysaccharide heptosyltransferase II [Planctomycetes bacterium]|nr:lipopolysaccharide heptosyltransferase II [Planctomycetota bacterium]MCW8134685.1 lipopolysaccharide heptosyltransferase II [Planctomycetota bacterium]